MYVRKQLQIGEPALQSLYRLRRFAKISVVPRSMLWQLTEHTRDFLTTNDVSRRKKLTSPTPLLVPSLPISMRATQCLLSHAQQKVIALRIRRIFFA